MGLCGSSSQGVDESDGLKVEGWIMGRKIGKGATGKVYLAKNQKTGTRAGSFFFFGGGPITHTHTLHT